MGIRTHVLTRLHALRMPSRLRAPRFTLAHAPVDLSTWRANTYEFDFEMATSCERAFDVVTGEDPAIGESWFPDFESIEWLTPTRAPGSRREYRTAYLTLVEEIDFWEPGRRFGFWVSRASWPIHTRFREMYELEARGAATRVRWSVSYEAHPRLEWTVPFGHRLFQKTFDAAAANLRALDVHPRPAPSTHDALTGSPG